MFVKWNRFIYDTKFIQEICIRSIYLWSPIKEPQIHNLLVVRAVKSKGVVVSHKVLFIYKDIKEEMTEYICNLHTDNCKSQARTCTSWTDINRNVSIFSQFIYLKRYILHLSLGFPNNFLIKSQFIYVFIFFHYFEEVWKGVSDFLAHHARNSEVFLWVTHNNTEFRNQGTKILI